MRARLDLDRLNCSCNSGVDDLHLHSPPESEIPEPVITPYSIRTRITKVILDTTMARIAKVTAKRLTLGFYNRNVF